MSAFTIPLSGLAAESDALNVIANNLANLNTDGYKSESLNFADIFNQMQGVSGNGDPIQIGGGVQVGGIVSDYTNGSVKPTGIDTNMALQGNGFFVVENPANSQMSYTRDGDFTVNSQGQLVTANGQLVLGYPAVNGQISAGASPAPISLNEQSTIPGLATTSFQMTTNLDASAATGTDVQLLNSSLRFSWQLPHCERAIHQDRDECLELQHHHSIGGRGRHGHHHAIGLGNDDLRLFRQSSYSGVSG